MTIKVRYFIHGGRARIGRVIRKTVLASQQPHGVGFLTLMLERERERELEQPMSA